MGSRSAIGRFLYEFAEECKDEFAPFFEKYGIEWKTLFNKSGKGEKATFTADRKLFQRAVLTILNSLDERMYIEVEDKNSEMPRKAVCSWRLVSTNEQYEYEIKGGKRKGETEIRNVKTWDNSRDIKENRWTVDNFKRTMQFDLTWKENGTLGAEEVSTIEAESAE